jgi:cobaltochelatase CobN
MSLTVLKFAQHPPLACRPSPPQGGRSFGGNVDSSIWALRLKQLISPPEGEMAGRPEGGEAANHTQGAGREHA